MEEKKPDLQSNDQSNHLSKVSSSVNATDTSINVSDLKYEILKGEEITCDLTFKVIIVGNAGVGKSCLSLKATKNIFDQNYNQTIGFEFFDFNICFEEKERIKLQIWDTCGQEVYRSFITNFYRNSSLAIIVYSIDDKKSFEDIDLWVKDLKSESNPDIKLFLLGNKADLEDKREVKYEEGEKIKNNYGFLYFNETSAKTGLNVTDVFVQAAKLLYKEYLKYKKTCTKRIVLPKETEKPSNIVLNNNTIKNKNKIKDKNNCC